MGRRVSMWIIAFCSVLMLSHTAIEARAGAAERGALRRVTRAEIWSQKEVPVFRFRVVRSYPHDPQSFTQGLFLDEGLLYEGTGLRGQSRLLRVEPATGHVLQSVTLDARYFGEGIALLGERIFQLTYRSGIGFIYDRNTFRRIGDFRYTGEGWGLTTDGRRLIMSDGTARLHFLDPGSMETVDGITVRDAQAEIPFLNELEWVAGQVYANVWGTDFLVRVDPATGRVTGWVDLSGINPLPMDTSAGYVLNGIAYDAASGHLLVTGKCWPHVFEIELVAPGS